MSNENEINVNITYSDFKQFFSKWFRRAGALHKKEEAHTLEVVKKYWPLLDSELRDDIISTFNFLIRYERGTKSIFDFLDWAEQNSKSSTPKPFNAFIELPVVDQSLTNNPYQDR